MSPGEVSSDRVLLLKSLWDEDEGVKVQIMANLCSLSSSSRPKSRSEVGVEVEEGLRELCLISRK
jgi:hypothetical protein